MDMDKSSVVSCYASLDNPSMDGSVETAFHSAVEDGDEGDWVEWEMVREDSEGGRIENVVELKEIDRKDQVEEIEQIDRDDELKHICIKDEIIESEIDKFINKDEIDNEEHESMLGNNKN